MTTYSPKTQSGAGAGADADADADADGDANDSPVPLYKLEVGVAPTALGIHCAAEAGVPECIVKRAREVREHIQAGTPINARQDASLRQNHTIARLLRTFLSARNWSDTQEVPEAKLRGLQVLLKQAATTNTIQEEAMR